MMKYLIILLLSLCVNTYAQEATCGVKGTPTNFTQAYSDSVSSLHRGSILTIPIVFHVVHLGESINTGTNISQAQILSAVTALNNDFANLSAQGQSPWGVNTTIQFCLASTDPSGNPTSGINRVNGSTIPLYSTQGINTGGVAPPGAVEMDIKNLSRWPRDKYCNIWIVSEIGDNNGGSGIQGYAYYPTTSVQDGIVQLFNATGTTGNLKSYTNRNGTLTHEMGHYLNLIHTFQGNSCTVDGDGVADTPPTILNSNCGTRACSGTQQIENYMDYTSEYCKNTLTQGQKDRMLAALTLASRSTLLSSNGCVSPYPIASFQLTSTSICVGDSVQATSYSSYHTSLQWTTGGLPASSTANSVWVKFPTAGVFNITLKATNSTSTDSVYRSVVVNDCSTTGKKFSNWFFGFGVGINFNPNPVAISPNSQQTQEAAGSLSSSKGILQYYTNGRTVWDKNNVIRATHLIGSSNGNLISSTQIAILPINDSVSYIFTTSDIESPVNNGLCYYRVDMVNGIPQVGPTQQPSANYRLAEGITIVPACPSGWWIIVKGVGNYTGPFISDINSKLIAYKFDGTTITGNQLSPSWTVDMWIPPMPGSNKYVGTFKSHPNGRLLSFGQLESDSARIYALDKTSGMLTFLTSVQGGYGSCFAGDYLYCANMGSVYGYYIEGLNVCNKFRPTRVFTKNSSVTGQMQLALDGHLYISRNNQKYISAVLNPSTTPTWKDTAVALPSWQTAKVGIVNNMDALEGQFPCADQCSPLGINSIKLILKQKGLINWIDNKPGDFSYVILHSTSLSDFKVIIETTGRTGEIKETGYYKVVSIEENTRDSNYIYYNSVTKTYIMYDILGRRVDSGKLFLILDNEIINVN